MEKELILVMENGETHVVIGETNVYWLCNGCQFRKANKHIAEVKEIKEEKTAEKPKKRKPPSGKKKAESTES